MKCIICEKEISIPLLASLYLKNDYTVLSEEYFQEVKNGN